MKSMKNNLRYWIGTMEKQLFSMLWVFLAVVVMMTLMEDEITLQAFMGNLSGYFAMIIYIYVFSNSFNCICIFYPLTVSMGSDRKASYWAMQVAQHLVMFELLALTMVAIIYGLLDGDMVLGGILISIGIAMVLVLQGTGTIISLVSLKFGRSKGTIVYIVVVVVLVLLIGVTAGVLAVKAEGNPGMQMDMSTTLKLVLPIAALLYDAVMMWNLYRVVRKCDLQFV